MGDLSLLMIISSVCINLDFTKRLPIHYFICSLQQAPEEGRAGQGTLAQLDPTRGQIQLESLQVGRTGLMGWGGKATLS